MASAGGAEVRPAGNVARIIVTLLVLWIPLSAIAVGSDVAEYQLFTALAEDPLSVTDDQLRGSDSRQGLIGLTQLAMFLVTGIAFIVWLDRVYRNLEPLGARELRYGSGWTIGGWFVPILNVWRPKQLVNDAWRGSDPDLEYGSTDWRGATIPGALTAWWAVYIASSVVAGGSVAGSGSTDPEQLRVSTSFILVSDGLDLVAAVLAIWVVLAVTHRQEARADRLGLQASVTWRPQRGWLVTGATAGALLAVVAAGLFSPDITPTGVPVASRGADGQIEDFGSVAAEDLREGDCFNDPRREGDDESAEFVGVEVVPCDQPHDYEAFADIELDAPEGEPYPGDEALFDRSAELCYDAFEATIAPDVEATPYGVFVLHPTSQSWAFNDRALLCAVTNYDGTELQGRVERLDD